MNKIESKQFETHTYWCLSAAHLIGIQCVYVMAPGGPNRGHHVYANMRPPFFHYPHSPLTTFLSLPTPKITLMGLHCHLMILVRNPVVHQSIAKVLASTAAQLPSLHLLLLVSTSHRNLIIFPLALPPNPAVLAEPAHSPPLRRTVG